MTMRQFTRWSGAAAIAAVSVLALSTGAVTFPDTALADGGSGKIGGLKGVKAPLPDLTGIVTNTSAAIALGKALFWDSNVGSDGQACASCHFHAGADSRVT